jgi:hypothetical protein
VHKAARVAAVVAIAGGLAVWLLAREAEQTASAPERERETALASPPGATSPATGGSPATSPAKGGQSGATAGLFGSDDDSRTPPLEKPATAADGFAELHVLAGSQPVPGARVVLYVRGGTRRAYYIAGAGVTGHDGIVRLPARPGRYLASAHAPSFAPAEKDFVRPAGAPVTAVELKLQQAYTLRGRVLSREDGEPVVHARVVAFSALPPAGFRGGPRPATIPPEERAVAESGVDGRFQLPGLAAGSYSVSASSVGHSRARARTDVPREGELLLALPPAAVIEGKVLSSSGSPASGAEVVAVSSSGKALTVAAQGGGFSLEVEPGTHRLSAQLAPEAGAHGEPIPVAAGRTVRGVVIQLGAGGGVAGTVFAQSSGKPLPGAGVTLGVPQWTSLAGFAVTDAAGSFSIGGLAPGSYDVAVHADGYANQVRRGVTVADGQTFPLQVGLTGTGSVAGLVADSAGRPLPGAVVQLAGGFGPQGLAGSQTEAATGLDGRYRLEGLSPGTVRLAAARDPSSFGPSRSVEVVESQLAQLDFALADNGVLTGHVRLKSGAPPDSSSTVVRALQQGDMGGFRDGSVLGTGQLDPEGGYQISLPPGVYRVMVAAGSGQRQQPSLATVTANQAAQLDLVLDDTVSGTSGSVLEPSGAPSANARVALLSAQRQTVGVALADAEGNFTVSQFRGAPPASVRARNGGRIGEVAVSPGSDSTVIQLQGAATLHGTLASGSAPPASFTVTVAPVDTAAAMWDPGAPSQLEFAGTSFDLYDQPGVDVTVSVRTADGRSGSQVVPLRPGQSATATIGLQDSAAVSGRIVNASGNVPVPGAVVLLDGSARLRSGSLAGQDGRFRLADLSAGTHSISVRAGQYSAPAQSVTVNPGQALDLGDIVLPLPRTPPGTLGVRFFNAASGVALGSVVPGGPADVAGIQEGDLLLALDGVAVHTPAEASARAAGAPATPVSVSFQHLGQAQTVQIFRAQ